MDIFDDDIFNEMRKMMRNPFTGFFEDSIFDDEAKIQAELEKAFKIDPSKDKKSRSYSISYKYGTGMKEPEIHVQGDIDKDAVNKILKGLSYNPNSLGMNIQSPAELNSDTSNSDAIEPYTEIQENPDGLSIVMEMPGIGQKDIKTKWEKDNLIITAEREEILYEKQIPISFQAKKDVEIHANNGIISIEIQKK